MTIGVTTGNVPVIYTFTTPPPNNISDAPMNPGQVIFDLSDNVNTSTGFYILKGGSVGSQVWVKFPSSSELAAMSTRSQSSPIRSLNTAFQVSTTKDAIVHYSVDISTTVSLTGSQVGQVILEIATNSAFTTGVQSLQEFSNGNTGSLVVGLVLTQLNTACVNGVVLAGYWVRLRTVNVTGTPVFTFKRSQEVLF